MAVIRDSVKRNRSFDRLPKRAHRVFRNTFFNMHANYIFVGSSRLFALPAFILNIPLKHCFSTLKFLRSDSHASGGEWKDIPKVAGEFFY